VNFSRLSPGEKLIFGCGLALLILSFMPWFKLVSIERTAWSNLISSLGVIAGILMVLQILLTRFGSAKLPTPKLPWGQVHLILGVFAMVMVFAQALIGDTFVVPGFGEVTLERRPSLILGTLAAFGLAYGGYVRSKEREGAGGGYP
jgi:hypothetical protein